MTDTNTVTLAGRLTRDAESRKAGDGEIATFSIASNRRVKRQGEWSDDASFFDIEKWNPGGLMKYLTKGTQVVVTGELVQERWEKDGQKRSKVKVVARSVQLFGTRGDSGVSGGESGGESGGDEEVPF